MTKKIETTPTEPKKILLAVSVGEARKLLKAALAHQRNSGQVLGIALIPIYTMNDGENEIIYTPVHNTEAT